MEVRSFGSMRLQSHHVAVNPARIDRADRRESAKSTSGQMGKRTRETNFFHRAARGIYLQLV
jgi:hypothetical protein